MKTKLLALGALFASLCASVQGQTPINTPVLHLSFDNVGGSTVTNGGSGGSAMDGTLNGSAVIASGGQFGNCLSISGASANSASCRIASSVVPLSVGEGNAWTVAMWVKSSTPGACYAYQGSGGWASGNTSFYFSQGFGNQPGTLAGGVRYAQGWVSGTTDMTALTGWHHLVLTCNGTTKTMYLDGVLETLTKNEWNGTGTGDQFWIGGNASNNDGAANLNGQIDEVYVFDKALGASDIQLLYSDNILPSVSVAVAVDPASGVYGQSFTVTATVPPGAGTVTNVTANLSAIGLSSTANLVLSADNVFTNSFIVPGTAPMGPASLGVVSWDTTPLVGVGSATFTVVPRPPTNAIVVAPISGTTSVYAYTEASFHFAATNDAPSEGSFPMVYAWYKNDVLVSTNPMGPNYTFLTTPADDQAQIYAIASVADTNYSSISVTSGVVTLTANPGALVYTNGLKQEFFAGATRQDVEIGSVAPGVVRLVSQADSAGGFGDNHARRYSGYFIPPTTDAYVFFVASDDDCDLFLSTDSDPANKQLIAQEAGYSGTRSWLVAGGSGSLASQKRSDQWTNSIGEMPYTNGFYLTAGNYYYIEAVMHNGTGGDNWAITYALTNDLFSTTYDPITETYTNSSTFVNGEPSRMTAASNNIAVITWPGTYLNWTLQPVASVTVFEGQTTNLSAIAASDAEMAIDYQWYINDAPYTGSGGTSTNLILASIPASYDGAQFYAVARTEGGSITSSVCILTVHQAVREYGFVKDERWNGKVVSDIVNGSVNPIPDFQMAVTQFGVGLDDTGGHDNFARRVSGYFVPAVTTNYVFYVTSDDDSVLFLSTDETPANKRQVCQQDWWNTGALDWQSYPSWVNWYNPSLLSCSTTYSSAFSNGIPLVAGQRYYIEQDMHQGGGGANLAATFTYFGEPAPAINTETRLKGSLIQMSVNRCSYVAFTQQPTNTTVAPMGYVSFSADGTTDSPVAIGGSTGYEEDYASNYLFYQWYKNGTPIAGANSKTLKLGPLVASDNGATIYCKMRALGFTDDSLNPIWTNSQTATITLSPQAVFEPGVATVNWFSNTTSKVSVENNSAGLPTFSFVTPKFESPVDGAPWDNYINRVCGFFIAPSNGVYVFFVNSDDDSDLFISTNGNPADKVLVAQETSWSNPFQWLGGGSVVSQKRSDQFTPDGGVTYPGNHGGVGGIPLIAGQVCWLEGVHRNGSGGNNFEVTFKEYYEADPVNGTDSRLAGDVIGTYVPRIPWVAFLQEPTNQTVLSGTPVTFTAQGTNAPSVWIGTTGNPALWLTNPPTVSAQYQWYKDGTPIPGATASSYTQMVLPSDQGAEFVCGLRALGYTDDSLNRIYSNSTPAVLTVVTDTVPPTISYAATFQNTNLVPPQLIVNVTFSKVMNAASLSNATYTIAGVNVTNVSIAGSQKSVQLLLDNMPTLPLTITVNGVTDLSGNALDGSSTTNINAELLTFTDVGNPPYYDYYFGQPGFDPAYPSLIFVLGNGSYSVSAEGSDIWGTQDGFNFGWELKTNDFDVVVRGVDITPTSTWAKMGLMARETLDANSRQWSIQNEPLAADGGANRVDTAMRTTVGGSCVGWQLTAGDLPPPSYPNAWLRLKRTITVTLTSTNDVMDGFYSTNGVSWVHAASYTNTTENMLTNVLLVGICTAAHVNDVVTTYPPPPPASYNTAEYADYNSSYNPTPAELSISISGSDVIVSWTGAGHLEASPALAGPEMDWQTVSGSSPVSVPIGSGERFFRVVSP
jgi:hypothetical protein